MTIKTLIFLCYLKVNYIDNEIDSDFMQPAKTPDELAEMFTRACLYTDA